jgi:hypothetical protein
VLILRSATRAKNFNFPAYYPSACSAALKAPEILVPPHVNANIHTVKFGLTHSFVPESHAIEQRQLSNSSSIPPNLICIGNPILSSMDRM